MVQINGSTAYQLGNMYVSGLEVPPDSPVLSTATKCRKGRLGEEKPLNLLVAVHWECRARYRKIRWHCLLPSERGHRKKTLLLSYFLALWLD